MQGLLLRVGLPLVDLVVRLLPERIAYALAEFGGRAWYRLAGGRRRLVSTNLARVSAALGRPTAGPEFRALVERAFVQHARYWLEVLRAIHEPPERLTERLIADHWEHWGDALRSGAVIAVPHFGNFEPFGHFLELRGLRGVAPVEETEPRELYEFLLRRRIVGGRGVRLVPMSRAVRPMLAALRAGEIVPIGADRDLAGDGIEVTIFGHATTLPAGPATLALRTGRQLLVARVKRVGRDQFVGSGWPIQVERSGNLRADVEALTRAIAERFEAIAAEAPDQWFALFQPYWSDQRRAAAAAAAGTAGAEADA